MTAGQGLLIDKNKSANLGASSVYESFKQQYGASKAWKYAWKRNPKEACSKSSGSLCSSNSDKLSESYFQLLMATSPAIFNARDPSYTGGIDVMKPPKDQKPCTTCVGFAAISAAETAVAVVLQKSVKTISLSVQDLQFCSSGAPSSCRTGWRLEPALDELQNRRNISSDYCLPYAPDVTLDKTRADLCRKQCSESDPDASTGHFSYVPISEQWHAQRHIRYFGNIITPFDLTKEFRDFFSNPANKNKVYKPGPTTQFEEGHAVVLVGYNNDEEYWVVKNSWGPDWADGGFFKVAYGTSGILTGSPAFGVTWEPASPLSGPITVEVDATNDACKIYVVQQGDYISKVAKMFSLKLEALLLDNQLVILNLDEPLEGKRLRLCSVPANVTLNIKPTALPPSSKASNATKCVASKKAFILKQGMTESQYKDEYTKAKQQGVRVATVSGYDIDGKAYYAALFIGKPAANLDHVWSQTYEAHQAHTNDMNNKSFCPSWLSAFTLDDQDYYNTLWEKAANGCPPNWAIHDRAIGIDHMEEIHKDNRNAGYRPFWVTGFGSTEHKFATIWKKERTWEAWAMMFNMRAADLQGQIDGFLAQGLQPVLINGYGIKGVSWYVAIFETIGDDGTKNIYRFGMTEPEYQSYQDQQTCAGYTPVHISAWTVGDQIRFAAIWKK
eukprot:jgi/Chrzof1/3742/Cz13g07080.t1